MRLSLVLSPVPPEVFLLCFREKSCMITGGWIQVPLTRAGTVSPQRFNSPKLPEFIKKRILVRVKSWYIKLVYFPRAENS